MRNLILIVLTSVSILSAFASSPKNESNSFISLYFSDNNPTPPTIKTSKNTHTTKKTKAVKNVKKATASVKKQDIVVTAKGVGASEANRDNASMVYSPKLMDVLNSVEKESLPNNFYFEHKVYYDVNKIQVNKNDLVLLDSLVLVLKKFPDLNIELEGHTDSQGSKEYNYYLSLKRTNAAADYLVSKGVARKRIKSVAKGESKLENDCDGGIFCNETGHQFNRRTIIRLKR